ncbi:indoleamine 2,3-dioxygenase subfamily [Macrophomina phaseolina]|uniref:Indoleamine 2,3-dioxygenase n=1 Tax=Macrophomina phaseolina TaxID=35725 RepID=A0ABQ8G2Q7_9PEZI|nr:indoleamine 2,3-dioxygenase subfamily [Macrophomina phaseolina]
MRTPIPRVEDYGISPTRGFLPADDPLERLSHPIYASWEALAKDLPSLIRRRKIRHAVEQLDVVSTEHLRSSQELRRACSLLGFIMNAYIWSGDQPATAVPPPISVPFTAVCKKLELPPVATYACLVLWNFKMASPQADAGMVENLSTLTTFTGLKDESWFYMISIAIEAHGAPMIPILLGALEAVLDGDVARVVAALHASAQCLDELSSLLGRMHEHCDPHVFYNRLRRFFAGSADVQRGSGQPNGVLLADGTRGAQRASHRGASNAQSSLFHFFDIVLGVDHCDHAPGAAADEPRENFLRSMRAYMPGAHRRFLAHVAAVANLRAFVRARAGDERLVGAFNGCVDALLALRRKHIQVVARYIVLAGSPGRCGPQLRDKKTAATTRSALAENPGRRGTGGTMLIPFLKQTAQETREAAVDVHLHSASK